MQIRNQGLLTISILTILIFIFSACQRKDPELSGFGDAFIKVEVVGSDTLYGLALHAFSFTSFASVEVTQGDRLYTLEPYLGFEQDYLYMTPVKEMSATRPPAGEYQFNALYEDGRTMVFSDRLYTSVARPARITECRYNRDSQLAEIAWLADQHNDAYNIKAFHTNGELLFVSRVYNNDSDYYAFGRNTQGWQTGNLPVNGQELIIEITAYLNQPETKGEKLQSIALSRQSLIWMN